ncbi:heterodisulfide reductase-related iron-sulfur binding cluster [Streptomyces mirabilis]|uniref:heterodisulfide reductase-related iron-sulfur binding cluster n=1 Tax=Streptomyces mirabilis TaxID=68239 RepID=UPI0035DA89FB
MLRAVKDLDLVDLPAADSCCGFGGISAVKSAGTSVAMLADKVRGVLDSGAEVLPPSTGPTSRPPAPASSHARSSAGPEAGGPATSTSPWTAGACHCRSC